MAINLNREISYENSIEYIEHITQRKVLSIKQDNASFRKLVVFTDGTCLYIEQGVNIEPLPKSICASCGEDSHCGCLDFAGRCEVKLKKIWESAKKCYWHRYLKNK